MKLARFFISIFCTATFALSALAVDPAPEAEAVRPTGAEKSPASERVSKKPKAKRARSTKKAQDDDVPIVTTAPGGSVPATGAKSVMIIAEHGYLDQLVRVEAIDTMAEPVKLNIKAGETYQRIDLLRALLVKSPNDVARCLARDNAGSIEAFAEMMNQRARELGATHSHFVNPNGLPVPGQYSSARDLSIIARAAYANSTIRSIVCLPQLVFRYANGRTRELENTNKLLRRLPYCNGMKTGYTEAAGKCLIASGSRPGKDVIVVVLGDSSAV